MIARSM